VTSKSSIEWTEVTWNPVTGCDRTSPGCDNCYALRLASRLKAMGSVRYQQDGDPSTSGPGFGVTCHWDLVDVPLRWKTPRLVFVNSMADLFHSEVPDSFISAVFTTMDTARQHTFQVLTKRSKRLAAVSAGLLWPKNVWMGVSVENAAYRFRIDHLREVPAAVRFLSIEPLIGPVGELDLTGIHWVIVGGESGPGSRPIDPEWVLNIRDQCVDAGVAFFFKQWGGRTPKAGGRELDGQVWDELPEPEKAGEAAG
jgi:protein gp37